MYLKRWLIQWEFFYDDNFYPQFTMGGWRWIHFLTMRRNNAIDDIQFIRFDAVTFHCCSIEFQRWGWRTQSQSTSIFNSMAVQTSTRLHLYEWCCCFLRLSHTMGLKDSKPIHFNFSLAWLFKRTHEFSPQRIGVVVIFGLELTWMSST